LGNQLRVGTLPPSTSTPLLAQELPKRLGVLDGLAPMDGLLLCPGYLPPFLLDCFISALSVRRRLCNSFRLMTSA
jgi:hypothetical protein